MPSSAVDIVKAYFGTFSVMSANKAALFLADDFKLIGFDEMPIGKEIWVSLMNALKVALPDLKIRLSEIEMEGNRVHLTHYGVGTHQGKMDFSVVDQPVFPPTGKTVTFPSAQWTLTVVDGKITQEEMNILPSSDTGLVQIVKAFS